MPLSPFIKGGLRGIVKIVSLNIAKNSKRKKLITIINPGFGPMQKRTDNVSVRFAPVA
jgi:hypothetical protein